jgi:hypothetical protein
MRRSAHTPAGDTTAFLSPQVARPQARSLHKSAADNDLNKLPDLMQVLRNLSAIDGALSDPE